MQRSTAARLAATNDPRAVTPTFVLNGAIDVRANERALLVRCGGHFLRVRERAHVSSLLGSSAQLAAQLFARFLKLIVAGGQVAVFCFRTFVFGQTSRVKVIETGG